MEREFAVMIAFLVLMSVVHVLTGWDPNPTHGMLGLCSYLLLRIDGKLHRLINMTKTKAASE